MQSVTDVPAAPRPRDFHATNRGGGLYSEAVSQWLGAGIAFLGSRTGASPRVLTIDNLLVGLAGSVTLVVLAPKMAAGTVPGWAIGLVALVLWQLAYAFDCADGQLARVTGRTSATGARLDVLCDVAVQIGLVTALSAVAVAYRPGTPLWLVSLFAGTWMVNLVTSVMQSGPNAASLVASRSPVVRLVKLVRDYGAVILVAGLVVTIVPQWTVVVLWAFTIVNGGFLLASIAASTRSKS